MKIGEQTAYINPTSQQLLFPSLAFHSLCALSTSLFLSFLPLYHFFIFCLPDISLDLIGNIAHLPITQVTI